MNGNAFQVKITQLWTIDQGLTRGLHMNLGLGIDTGGTYTDSVIIDLSSGNILSKAKALTTRNDLAIGILNSIDKLDRSAFEHVQLVSVSSTLATNSVVEGKGCRVGLIVVGHEFNRAIPVNELV